MKKRLVQALLLSSMIVSLDLLCAPPVKGESESSKAEIVTREEAENLSELSLYSGVTKDINFQYMCLIMNYDDTLLKNSITYIGWTTCNLNVRESASTESDVIGKISFNTEVEYSLYEDNWLKINYNGREAYIYGTYVTDTECPYEDYSVPTNKGFKSYMSYKTITSKSSTQYLLQKNYAYTGNYGIRQANDGRYCVAIGTAFNAEVGTYFDLILENGTVIPCIVADIKADIHTESNNIVTAHNGCVSEFIVDTDSLNKYAKRDGDISSCCEEWDSPVVTVRIYDKNIFNEVTND